MTRLLTSSAPASLHRWRLPAFLQGESSRTGDQTRTSRKNQRVRTIRLGIPSPKPTRIAQFPDSAKYTVHQRIHHDKLSTKQRNLRRIGDSHRSRRIIFALIIATVVVSGVLINRQTLLSRCGSSTHDTGFADVVASRGTCRRGWFDPRYADGEDRHGKPMDARAAR